MQDHSTSASATGAPSALPRTEDSVVIVTGASQGIGAVFARAFAEAGARVVLADINIEKATGLAQELGDDTRVSAIATDVSDEASVAAMVAATLDRHGRIDVLINNAALFSTLKMQPFYEIPIEVWDRVMKVNVNGPFLCSRAVVPAMRDQGYGRIINISSGAVTLGRPNYLHYIASKAALIGMTRSMARELGGFGITVNAILPGSTVTEIARETVTDSQRAQIIARQCIQRSQRPSDIVSTAMYLSSPETGFVTGQAITVDGGASHP